MTTRSLILLALFTLIAACGNTDADALVQDDPGSSDSQALSAVEDVTQYASCRENGHGSSASTLDLAHFGERDPGLRATFATADCIVGRLTDFKGRYRPYSLQSFKRTAAGQTFFFKRTSYNEAGEAKPQCLKIKLSVFVGATDDTVTVSRVKQLPDAAPDALCSDNGET
jgi:hypothetical protein